jgi:type IV secretion system protein VirB9
MYVAIQRPIPSATAAADIVMPPENRASQGDRENMNVTSDISNGIFFDDSGKDGKRIIEQGDLEILLDGNGDVIGWKRKQNENELPFQLPSRNTRTDEDGTTIIEVDDPDSIIFDQKLYEVEKLPEIRPVDEVAISLAKAYSEAAEAPRPFMASNNGRIDFYFGTMNPRIICRPLRLTDIELEPGEQVKNVHISDAARWSVSGAWSGELENLVTHVILKPQLPDIAANLLIHTDRRTYAIELISMTTEEYMPRVGFLYPETPKQTSIADSESWENLLKQYQLADEAQAQKNEKNLQSNARLADPATINTEYTIKVTKGKNIAWKPKVVYSAGGKTYVVMPEKMQITEAPVFFIKQNGREKLTNYRVEGNIYIVDRIFDIGILTIGKDRVAIYRKTPVGKAEKEVVSAEIKKDAPRPKEERNKTGLSITIGSEGIDFKTDYEEEIPVTSDVDTPSPQQKDDKENTKPTDDTSSPQSVETKDIVDVPKNKDTSQEKDTKENTEPGEKNWEEKWDELLKKYGLEETSNTDKKPKKEA